MQISLWTSAASEPMHSSRENSRLVHGKRRLFHTAPSPIGRNELNLCQGRAEVNKKKARKPKMPGARQDSRGHFLSLSFRSSNQAPAIFSNSATAHHHYSPLIPRNFYLASSRHVASDIANLNQFKTRWCIEIFREGIDLYVSVYGKKTFVRYNFWLNKFE